MKSSRKTEYSLVDNYTRFICVLKARLFDWSGGAYLNITHSHDFRRQWRTGKPANVRVGA